MTHVLKGTMAFAVISWPDKILLISESWTTG